jgi:hypothetical protein
METGEGNSAGYEASGIPVRSAFGMVGKNLDFRASAFSEEVIAMPEGVTRLGLVGGVGGRWLLPVEGFVRSVSCSLGQC